MEARTSYWSPGITGHHLPAKIVSKCDAKSSSFSRRKRSLQDTRISASAIGRNTQISMTISISLVGEAPSYRFLLPQLVRDNVGISATKRRCCQPSSWFPLSVTLLALSSGQEERQARQENSALRESDSSSSRIAPYWLGQIGSEMKDGLSLLKLTTSFDSGCEGEIIHREMLSRLKTVEVTAVHKNHWAPRIADPGLEPLRSAGSPDMSGESLAKEYEKWLLPPRRRSLRETGEQQLENSHIHQRDKETRRSMVKHCLPPILDKLGFQFSSKILPDLKNRQQAARVNVIVSYLMSYVLETGNYSLDIAGRSDMDVPGQYGLPTSLSKSYHPRKAAVFASAMGCRMSSRRTSSVKMGMMTRERVHQMSLGQSTSHFGGVRPGRVFDCNARSYAGSAGILRCRPRVPAKNKTGRRLWLRAESGLESAGHLFMDLLTIVGLVAFVVSGTYAFAMSQQYFKSGHWFRKTLSEAVSFARPAEETYPKTPNLNRTSVAEVTDENFVDTIKKRPTFVLFYLHWCPFCQKLDPTWNALGEILSKKGYDVQIAKMNAELHPNTAKNFNVVKYPTLILFKGGIAADHYLGPRTVHALMEFLEANLRS